MRAFVLLALVVLVEGAVRLQRRAEPMELASKVTLNQNMQKLSGFKVPTELREIGLRTFGSAEKLADFEADSVSPRNATIGGISMQLTMSSTDAGGAGRMWQKGEDPYRMHEITATEGLIVDVGGNIGDSVIMAAKMHPRMQVIAFEPVPPNYFRMLWNCKINGVPLLSEEDLGKPDKPGVILMMKVVGDGRKVPIDWNPHGKSTTIADGTTSAGSTEAKMSGEKAHVDVPSVVFPKMLASHGVGSIRLLKVDCEGCEFFIFPLLRELVTDKKKVERLELEIHPGLASNPESMQEFAKIWGERGCGTHLDTNDKTNRQLHC